MVLFTQWTPVLHKYFSDELKPLCLLQFFPEVAQNSLSFNVQRSPWVFQVCGHPDLCSAKLKKACVQPCPWTWHYQHYAKAASLLLQWDRWTPDSINPAPHTMRAVSKIREYMRDSQEGNVEGSHEQMYFKVSFKHGRICDNAHGTANSWRRNMESVTAESKHCSRNNEKISSHSNITSKLYQYAHLICQ